MSLFFELIQLVALGIAWRHFKRGQYAIALTATVMSYVFIETMSSLFWTFTEMAK